MKTFSLKIFVLAFLIVGVASIIISQFDLENPYKNFLNLNRYAMAQDYNFEFDSGGDGEPGEYSILGKCGTVFHECTYICVGRPGVFCGRTYSARTSGKAYDLEGTCMCGTPVFNN